MSEFELVAVRRSILKPDTTAIAVTATGSVWLSPGFLNTAPPDVAWAGLQDLHYRAIGASRVPLSPRALDLTPVQAWEHYSSGIASVLGQLGVTGPEAGENILGSLHDYASLTGNLDGLESPFLSAFTSAARDERSPSLEDAAALLKEVGIPDRLGGGADRSPTFDVQTGRMVLNDVQTLVNAFSSASLDAERVMTGLNGLMEHTGTGHASPSGPAAPTDAQQAVHAIWEVASATAVGAAAGGPIGGVIGLLAGVAAAFFDLFASHPPDPAQAKQASEGKSVCVERTEVVTKTESHTITVGPDGTKTETQSSTTSASSTTTTKSCVAPPEPTKCWRDEDGSFDPDYAVPYWQESATMVPSLLTHGPGLDAEVNLVGDSVLQLVNLPSIDQAGLNDGGLLAAVVASARRPGPGRIRSTATGTRRLTTGGARELVVEVPTPNGRPPVLIRVSNL